MMSLSKLGCALVAITLSVGVVAAADVVTSGKIKSVNADNKSFVMTDAADKDYTFKLGDSLVINRSGKESKSDLKAGDPISVCYETGVFSWTAHYILINEGDAKNSKLVRGNVKSYDPETKELAVTSENAKDKDLTFAVGAAAVRLNMKDSKIADIKIGDHALLIVDMVGDKSTLRSVMVDRK